MTNTMAEWIGRGVSIECDERLGVFQGIITKVSADDITIVRAFRNGVPLRKQDASIQIRASDIQKISIIPAHVNEGNNLPGSVIKKPTPVKQPNFADATNRRIDHDLMKARKALPPLIPLYSEKGILISEGLCKLKIETEAPAAITKPNRTTNRQISEESPAIFNNSVTQFFGNLVPAKVEERVATACTPQTSSKPVNIPRNPANMNGNNGANGPNRPSQKQISFNLNPGGGFADFLKHSEGGIVNDNGNGAGYGNSGSYGNGSGYGSGTGSGNGSGNGNGSCNGNGNGNGNKRQFHKYRRENSIQQTFGAAADDFEKHEDFDFEGNLALFDKKAIWNVIEAGQRNVSGAAAANQQRQPYQQQQQHPSKQQQQQQQQQSQGNRTRYHSMPSNEQKYRHNENVLASEPAELRQIETAFETTDEFTTDEGLIIPSIPHEVRDKIETLAEQWGLTLQRQYDILARGAADLSILLLGGARRLTPKNCHQWPIVTILCERANDYRASNVGADIGRQLASHGIKVALFLEESPLIEIVTEIKLYKATGNIVTYNINDLPKPDLVILSSHRGNLAANVLQWLKDSRAPILAIDPPPNGVADVNVRYGIVPILPLNGINQEKYGKLYLCNLGIPDRFYTDAGIKYKSPFGHKFMIPIHLKH